MSKDEDTIEELGISPPLGKSDHVVLTFKVKLKEEIKGKLCSNN